MNKNINSLRTIVKYYAYLFVVWGFYRLLFQFPDPLEEIIFKPLVWLIPLYWILKKSKVGFSELGFKFGNFFHVVYFSIFLGFLFSIAGLLINYLKYGNLIFMANLGQGGLLASVALSFVTATVEEIPFRGYIFGQFSKLLKNEWKANIITSIGWVGIHLPIAIFDWQLGTVSLIIYLAIIFCFSIGASFVFARTKNIMAPILLHVFWQWPIILFR